MDSVFWISSVGILQPQLNSLASASHFCAQRWIQEQETLSETCFYNDKVDAANILYLSSASFSLLLCLRFDISLI